jgi:hypothetical protein
MHCTLSADVVVVVVVVAMANFAKIMWRQETVCVYKALGEDHRLHARWVAVMQTTSPEMVPVMQTTSPEMVPVMQTTSPEMVPVMQTISPEMVAAERYT